MLDPQIHSDAELWDLETETGAPIYRAFTGVWNFSDREGRFEWKPRQLKALILPFWDGDFSRVLDALATRGFLVRYECDGASYGVVRSFHKHQSPNGREAASTLPPPPKGYERFPMVADVSSTRRARVSHAKGTLHDGSVLEGSVLEGSGGEGETRDAREQIPPPTIEAANESGLEVTATVAVLRRPEPVELEPDEPDCGPDERLRLRALVRTKFELRYHGLRGNTPSWTHTNVAHCSSIATWLDDNHGQDPRAALGKLLDGFFGNDKAQQKGFPIAFLANDPTEYFAPPKRSVSGFMPPSPAEAFTGPLQTGDDLFGPIVEPQPKPAGGRRG